MSSVDPVRPFVRALLGRRLPTLDGTIETPGVEADVRIDRDRWGVPHIRAGSDTDAFFALGFCLGQDRGFQMESLLRAARGTVSALAGPTGVPIDRLSRRIGFHRSAAAQLGVIAPDLRSRLDAYARGVWAGLSKGGKRPHELALAFGSPSEWSAVDVLAVGKLIAFGLALNWESELARLKVLELDGPAALRAVDPTYPSWLTVVLPPGTPAGPAVDRLAGEIAALRGIVSVGASNAWAIAPARTASGHAILANDPHLYPTLPPLFYLVDLQAPDWRLVGATMPGIAGIAVGHNESAAWGVTNGAADCVDLFLEELDLGSGAVREGEDWVECEAIEERIAVRGRRALVERVLVTRRGPVISPALPGGGPALSMSATFLEAQPLEGYLRLEGVETFEDLRSAFRAWPSAPVNVLFAGRDRSIGWQFAAQLPRRRPGHFGLVPQRGSEDDAGWEGLRGLDEMPWALDPDRGFLVSANNQPVAENGDAALPFLGADWADGYRAQRISEAISGSVDWDVERCRELQLDKIAIPWREIRSPVLDAAKGGGEGARRAGELLEQWDGRVEGHSVPATIYQLLLAGLARRFAEEKAPRGAAWALGRGFGPLGPWSFAAIRWTGHLSGLIRRPPADPGFDWPRAIADTLDSVVDELERTRGRDSSGWAWGEVRMVTLRHPLSERWPMHRVFDLGPVPYGGDAATVDSAPPPPLDPTGDPVFVPLLRVVIDTGDWEGCSWVLAGGQSGNPFSPHYADQFALWRRGEAIRIPWSADAIRAATRHTLTLRPSTGGADAGWN